MEQRFDKLEQMIGSLAETMGARFNDVNQRMGAGFEDVNRRMDAGFEDVNLRVADVNQRLDENIKDVNQRMDAGFMHVNQRISVLHEDVKSEIRFTLEARQALREVMDEKFAEQERSFKDALAPIADAVRSSFRK